MPYPLVIFVFSGLRGSCSVCWYGWNCWSSLFIFSFHKDYNKKRRRYEITKNKYFNRYQKPSSGTLKI